MKFLVIGLGSMGKRRIGNLLTLGVDKKDIRGFDLSSDRRVETFNKFKIATHFTVDSALLWKPDVFIISTPPDHHVEYMKKSIELGIPCFVEASVCIEGMKLLNDINNLIHPSATMRFSKLVRKLKNAIPECKRFKYSCKSWLPDWHPHEDIKDFYVSKKETGACREMVPFELEWLVWIFGDIKHIIGNVQSSGEFGDIDDCYDIIIEFESGIFGDITVDIITKEAKGGIREMIWEDSNGFLSGIIVKCKEDMYVREMKHFIDSLNGNTYLYSLEEDIEILELLEEIEK